MVRTNCPPIPSDYLLRYTRAATPFVIIPIFQIVIVALLHSSCTSWYYRFSSSIALLDMHHLTCGISRPFFIPSTSYCSLSSWFTSFCAYHLMTVVTFAFHKSLSGSFWAAFTDIEPVREVGTDVVCFSFFFFDIFVFGYVC